MTFEGVANALTVHKVPDARYGSAASVLGAVVAAVALLALWALHAAEHRRTQQAARTEPVADAGLGAPLVFRLLTSFIGVETRRRRLWLLAVVLVPFALHRIGGRAHRGGGGDPLAAHPDRQDRRVLAARLSTAR